MASDLAPRPHFSRNFLFPIAYSKHLCNSTQDMAALALLSVGVCCYVHSTSPSFPISVWGGEREGVGIIFKAFFFISSSLHSGTLQKYTTGHGFPSEEFLGWKKHAYVGEGLHTHIHHLNASYAFSVLTQHRLVGDSGVATSPFPCGSLHRARKQGFLVPSKGELYAAH